MKINLLFPGQGSQHVGMGKFLCDEFSVARQVFEEASDAISVDLKKMCFDSDEATLALTHNTQPALLTVSVATFSVLKSIIDLKVNLSAGHSVGEYAALATAGTMILSDAVKAVRFRGQAMQEAVPVGQGGMLAVMGLLPEEVESVCRWAMQESKLSPLEPANFNSPDQTVVSGSAQIVEWVRTNFSAEKMGLTKRVKFIPLKVSAPFHCSMMKPAEEKMSLFLKETPFKDAQWAVVQNFTAKSTTSASELKKNIISQITGSVRWTQSMDVMKSSEAIPFVECGSGKVLAGLLKKSNPEAVAVNLNSLEDLKSFERSAHGLA